MKRHVLLFDGDCAACSNAARLVRELALPDLEVLALRDPRLGEMLDAVGRPVPDRPSLLVTDSDQVQVLSGWSMRRQLASMIGWRRSRTITRLLIIERRARIARDIETVGPSRRRFVGVGVAGGVGLALFPRSTAARQKATTQPSYAPAAASDVDRALASSSVGRAMHTWGPVEASVTEVRDGAERVLLFTHREAHGHIVTLVDNSADAKTGSPISLSMGTSPTAGGGLRFYTVDGVPLADLTVMSNGNTGIVPVAQPGGQPTIVPEFSVRCWLLCLQGFNIYNVSPGCLSACEACFGLYGGAIQCAHCFICAGGTHAVTCAKRCA
jgi:predicted DCC family thiol-disulfide oxidoreductase YuxK